MAGSAHVGVLEFFGDSLAFPDDLFVFYSICSVFIHSDTYSSGSISHSLTSNLGGLLYIFGTLCSSFRSFWSAVPSDGAHPVHPCSEAAWAPVSLVSDSTAVVRRNGFTVKYPNSCQVTNG